MAMNAGQEEQNCEKSSREANISLQQINNNEKQGSGKPIVLKAKAPGSLYSSQKESYMWLSLADLNSQLESTRPLISRQR